MGVEPFSHRRQGVLILVLTVEGKDALVVGASAFSLKVSRSDLFQRAEVSFERCGDDIVRDERSERLVGVGCVVPCFFAQ